MPNAFRAQAPIPDQSDMNFLHSPQTTHSRRNLAIAGVMLVIFLFAIDATIVSTSMPTIVARLGGLELYSWVFSIYMLTSALTTPLFGKLADLFAHRRLMLIGIGIFGLGSPWCGRRKAWRCWFFFAPFKVWAAARSMPWPSSWSVFCFLRSSAPRCRASSAAFGGSHRSSVPWPAD